jgi:hypothetical protein
LCGCTGKREERGCERGAGKAELGVVLGGGSTDTSAGQRRPSWGAMLGGSSTFDERECRAGISARGGKQECADDDLRVFLVVEIY